MTWLKKFRLSRLLLFVVGLFICLAVNLTTLSSIQATDKKVSSNLSSSHLVKRSRGAGSREQGGRRSTELVLRTLLERPGSAGLLFETLRERTHAPLRSAQRGRACSRKLPAPFASASSVRSRLKATEFHESSTPPHQNSTNGQAAAYYWRGEINAAISMWESLLQTTTDSEAATIHSYLGIAYREIGQLGSSVRHFKEAIDFYQNKDEDFTQLAPLWIEQAKTFNELGQWKRAQPLLKKAVALAEDENNIPLKTIAYNTICTAYWLEGNFDNAIEACETSRNLASISERTEDLITALNNLTNIFLSRSRYYSARAEAVSAEGKVDEQKRLKFLADQDRQGAIIATENAVRLSHGGTSLSTVRALINLSKLSKENKSQIAKTILEKLPPSRSKAELLILLARQSPKKLAFVSLKEALSTAEIIGSLATQAIAQNQLGHLYEKNGQYSQALKASERGQWIAQQVNALDSLYRLQWLQGRIYRKMHNKDEALKAYRSAISNLQQFRLQIASASPEWQLDLKQEVEPVYRELLILLLEENRVPSQNLKESLKIFEQLQFTQLQSFFGDACLELRQTLLDSQTFFPRQAAIIHTIILDNSTYTILELPNGSVYAYPIQAKARNFEKQVKAWRKQLENRRIPSGSLDLSERFYDLLIRPMESQLAKAKPEELVFINDGLLRNIPPAALYDGKQFLIEKYPISLSLGINSPPLKSSKSEPGASIFGLSESRIDRELNYEFSALPNVPDETLQVQKTVGGDRFLDKNFTLANFEEQIQENYSIVHLATHGEFGGSLESTFLRAYDRTITLSELEQLLGQRQASLDLLTLSACDTASGNESAVLGLAGVTLRAGVKNVMASLWSVDDKTTTVLITDFYRYLKQGSSNAQALQQAQINQLTQERGISSWAAFVAIRN